MTLTEDVYQKQKDAEKLFAAAAFISPGYVIETCGWMRPELIVDQRIQKFWAMIKGGSDNLEASFEAGLQPEIMRWVNDTPTSMGAREYANQISKHSYLAGISSNMSRLANAIGNYDAEAATTIVDEMHSERPITNVKTPNASDAAEAFANVVASENRNIRTGIPGLDNNTGGLERQTESILAGRPSMGKTSLSLQIARNVAGPEKMKVNYFSLEMSKVSLWARVACPEVGLTWMDVRAKKITSEQEAKLLRKSAELATYYGERFRIIDTPQTSESIWNIVSNDRPDLVVIDHLRRVRDKGDNEVKRQGLITERGVEMAKDLNCHVMINAQLSRAVEQRTDKRPMLADLRDSGEIEENADQVFMMYRDSYYNPPSFKQKRDETELWIRKFRDGEMDALVRLAFLLDKQWFEPWQR